MNTHTHNTDASDSPHVRIQLITVEFWVGVSSVLYLTLGVRPAAIGLGFMVQSLGTDDHRIAKMAQQVKDVLPHVPMNVIAKDLGRAQFSVRVYIWTLLLCAALLSTICSPTLCSVHSICNASFKNLSWVKLPCTCTCLLTLYSKNQLCWHHHNKFAGEQGGNSDGSNWDVDVWSFYEQLLLLWPCSHHKGLSLLCLSCLTGEFTF